MIRKSKLYKKSDRPVLIKTFSPLSIINFLLNKWAAPPVTNSKFLS